MIEIQVTLEVAASISEISKNTDLTDDAVANIAATMGLCSLPRETPSSVGGVGADRLEGTAEGSPSRRFPEAPRA